MRPVLSAAVAILLAGCMSPASTTDPAAVAWTQFGQGDDPPLIARVLIEDGASCPAITIDGVTTTMPERRDSRAAMFGRMCEERRPLGQAMRIRIAYGNRVLLDQNVTRDPATIAVLGDTGCRITSFYDQGCGDPSKWPFAQVADAAAARAPSLILHLGDYYYRETPCKGSSVDCVKAPYGDRPETWRAEFFAPARNLLPKAPWVFVRGNHEDCMRGGYGWNYYFADGISHFRDGDKPAGRKSETCAQVSEESIIRLAGLTLVNVDSAHADDKYAARALNAKWKTIADSVVPRVEGTSGPVVVMTHDAAYTVCPEVCDKDEIANIGG
ncbi:MAG TPA: metallophosphoesterase, partial [Reyranella sp.]|nr:metallophosphoesterase [Reyranella sp.]